MCRLRWEFINREALAVERAADWARSLVTHRHPFELLYADLFVELKSAHIVRAEHFGSRDHLHPVLRLAEHAAPSLPEGILVDDDLAEVANDIVRTFPGDDAV